MDKFLKTYKIIPTLLIILLVVGLFTSCALDEGTSTTSITFGSTTAPSNPQITTNPSVVATVPTAESTTAPSTEPSTAPTTTQTTTTPTTTPSAKEPQKETIPSATKAPKETAPPATEPSKKPGSYVGVANTKTGLSWDGVSPIIYTYPDGTTGTVPKDGATYESKPGVITTYRIYHDASGRTDGDICQTCGKEISLSIKSDNPSGFCKHDSRNLYCSLCGTWVVANKCHNCIARFNGIFYCEDCGRVCGNDGSNGKCVSWMTGGNHTCSACGATVPGHTCHTCSQE